MIYITIILCTLIIACAAVLWRYYDSMGDLESVYDTQLDDISIIIGRAKDRHELYMQEDSSNKFNYRLSDIELADIFDDVYRISTRGYEPDNK